MIFDFQKMLKSFVYALKGIQSVLKLEQNFRIHLVIALLAIIAGFCLSFSVETWGIVIISIFFVLVSELWNTALERICDEMAGNKKSPAIGKIKDISAGAVFLSALSAFIIGIIFIVIPIINKIVHVFYKN